MKAPIRIYLDQNVISNLLKSAAWRKAEIGVEIEKARKSGLAEVWISPSHVIETVLSSDPALRRSLADLMLTLSDAGRMTDSSDMVLVQAFGNFLNQFVPDSFSNEGFIEAQRENDQRFWLGTLGLLAWNGKLRLGPGVSRARLTKLRTQHIAARILANPDKELEGIIKAAQTFAITPNMDPLRIDNLSDEQLASEIARIKSEAKKPSRDILAKVQKHRAEICAVYGAAGIGSALRSVFSQFDLYFGVTFDCSKIVAGWSALSSKFGIAPLPLEVTGATPMAQRLDPDVWPIVINACLRAAANANLSIMTAGYYSLVRELEICVNQGDLPTAGATIDSDHVTCALLYDVFVSQDTILGEALKAAAKIMGKEFEVVSNGRQLGKVLAAVERSSPRTVPAKIS